MFRVEIKSDDGLERYEKLLKKLKGRDKRKALSRAVNKIGEQGKTRVIRALVPQTGLPKKVITKAVGKPRCASQQRFQYVLRTRGGYIALKHFKPKETRRGVKAFPRGEMQVFDHTFMKAGWVWRKRVVKPEWHGQVWLRVGEKYNYAASHPAVRAGLLKRKRTGSKFEKQISDVAIPEEMIRDRTAAEFRAVSGKLPDRVAHEVRRLLKSV